MLELGHIIKIEPVGFADGLDVEKEEKEGIQSDFHIFGLSI